VCRRLRRVSNVPVIMLTARGDDFDVVAGLEAGADDYVVKPVEPRVLDARIKAVLRRSGPAERPAPTPTTTIGSLTIDESAMVVRRDGVELELTPTELRLLLELSRHAGHVLSRRTLLERVWDYGYLGDSRLVDACIQRLRAKIEVHPSDPAVIKTVRGIGYRMVRA
jgi:DNA-binding response OmpR family regulator